MKKTLSIILFLLFTFTVATNGIAQEQKTKKASKVNYEIDNMGYWRRMAAKGYVPVAPDVKPKPATIKGSQIAAKSVKTDDSPDVPVSATGADTQSEVSVFVHPADNSYVLNSNNSTSWTGSTVGSLYGTSFLNTDDYAVTWGGSVQGAGGANSGDPAAVIGLDGRQYIGFIQGVSYSTDGIDWTSVVAGTTTGSMLDKNHLWIDNSLTSPYAGNVYDAWTDFGGSMNKRIGFVRSTDGGLTYSTPINISSALGGYLHQGVNIQTGPAGEVYVTWSVYDTSTLSTSSYGFAKSIDGGATFTTPIRMITNTKGIRDTGVLKNHRVNSFPSMAVDISSGANSGNIYMVWSNIGVPGTNTGSNKSVYMLKSTDGGTTWQTPIKVNQGAFADGKEAYFSWITCDPVTGVLSVIFYDDRNVSSTEVETWVANSYDAGETWEDFRVSDVAFTPQAIPGLAGGYMGDYLGISARDGMVYPAWPDNRNGYIQTFVSPFETNTRVKPINLNISLTEATGQTDLTWDFAGAGTFEHFIVYRDNVEIGTTTDLFYTDMLPTYGVYTYAVSAMHNDGESSSAKKSIQWGNPDIDVTPTALVETLDVNQTSTKILTITNTGELDLTYNIDSEIISKSTSGDTRAYCAASGGGDEYISGVVFGSINNTGTTASGYSDYTSMSTDVDAGNTYSITITNGNVYSSDDLGVWIDLNQDEDFDDAGENLLCLGGMGGAGTFDIAIPDTALAGQTRMRIRLKYSGSDCGSPCGTTSYGEVEDYTLNINSWLQVETLSGTLAAGATENINVHFDSTDLAFGDYFATLHIASNDTDEPLVDIPVTLHVLEDTSLTATATADEYTLCSGNTTTLHANPVGGQGSYTYSWTSTPVGFTSTEENPSVSPTEDTQYTVEVADGVDVVVSSVDIMITSLPIQPEIPSGDTVLCQDAANTTYSIVAVTGADSYEWTLLPYAAGTVVGGGLSVEINWDTNFNGAATLVATAVNSCGGTASEALDINVNELPAVSTANDMAVCIDLAPFSLSGGSPSGGTYSGVGVTAGDFNPLDAGVGAHTITYSYTNANGCEGFATQVITVNALPTVTLATFASIPDITDPFLLVGGTPDGGAYSGVGVTDNIFYPAVAGVGVHTITYTFIDTATGCENYAEQTLEVYSTVSVEDLVNGVSFSIYPNPNKGSLFLNINANTPKELQVVLLNQIGVVVMKKDISVKNTTKFNFDLSKLSAGVYHMVIRGEELNYTRRIIKK